MWQRANATGSWARSHISFGRVKPGIGGDAGNRRDRRHGGAQRVALGAARASFHRIAGRSGRPSAARSNAACIWPDRPTARSAAKASGAAARTLATTASVARHQSSGSCSDQPGRGRDTARATAPSARTSPSSTSTAFTAEVPTSIPRTIMAPAIAGNVRDSSAYAAPRSAPPKATSECPWRLGRGRRRGRFFECRRAVPARMLGLVKRLVG